MTSPRDSRVKHSTAGRLLALVLTIGALGACSSGSSPLPELPGRSAKVALVDSSESVVVTGNSPAEVTAALSAALFESAPAAVLADPSADLAVADDLGIPVLIVSDDGASTPTPAAGEADQADSAAPNADTATVGDELERLGVDTVLALGAAATRVADQAGVEAVPDAAGLPEIEKAEANPETAVIVAGPETSGLDEPTTAAVATTSAAAGATVIRTRSGDPRETRESVDAAAAAKPTRVIGVGDGLGDPAQLAARMEAASTGVQLPGGGQLHAPGKQYIAQYGYPGVPVLGVLGEQDLDASVERAKRQAAAYEELTDQTVVPMFEIITTVALGEPSPNGNYTNEPDPELFRPWVERAGEEGIYVVLDLQPGRADLVDQAKKYESLLRHPHVGLAIDPEWKLKPDQRPLQQIGQVQAEEVNRVGDWLSGLTRENNLPQKLFVLHQFQLRMLPDREQIKTDHDELQTLIHVDGQGPQGAKQDTWRVMTESPPENVVWGWKNFHDEDSPMLTPQQTINQVDPSPVMISYQ
ncbi:hypothetical protein [Granulicoccus sp. GXG6511]|uniref:hypothetical protein n=1 Tax=Granulicoccus sp. GXG6511 TaxID=3381351 RepID=UPI003D7CF24E